MKLNKLLLTCLVLALIVGISEARWGRKSSSSSRSRGGFLGSLFKKVVSKVKIPNVHNYGSTLAKVSQRSEIPNQVASSNRESQANREPLSVLPLPDMRNRPESAPTNPKIVYPRREIAAKTIFGITEKPKLQKHEDIMKLEIDQDPYQLADYQSNSDLIF